MIYTQIMKTSTAVKTGYLDHANLTHVDNVKKLTISFQQEHKQDLIRQAADVVVLSCLERCSVDVVL